MHLPSSAATLGPARSGGPIRAIMAWLRRAEAWLDRKGRGAWIAAMVLGFIFAWPIGLFLVFYITWTHRWSPTMFGHSCRKGHRHDTSRHDAARQWAREWGRPDRTAFRPSGNAAFDAYKSDTLRRLEEEQEAFEGFLQRLRAAKDKKEFDAFMEDRARSNREADQATDGAGAGTPATDGAKPEGDTRRGEY